MPYLIRIDHVGDMRIDDNNLVVYGNGQRYRPHVYIIDWEVLDGNTDLDVETHTTVGGTSKGFLTRAEAWRAGKRIIRAHARQYRPVLGRIDIED